MVELINKIVKIWREEGDKRAINWFLLRSPGEVFMVIFVYVIIAKIILPKVFKNQKHLSYKSLLGFYFIIHSLISFYYIYIFFYFGLQIGINYRCTPNIQNFHGIHYEIAVYTYSWLWFKISEMLETFLMIFIYGKVQDFIFVHHILFPFFIVLIQHFYLGGSHTVFGLINNIDHAFVFFLVGLRTLSDDFKNKTEWWFKKFHIFISISFLSFAIIFYLQIERRADCDFGNSTYFTAFFLTIFLILVVVMRWDYIKPKKEGENGGKCSKIVVN